MPWEAGHAVFFYRAGTVERAQWVAMICLWLLPFIFDGV